MRVRKHEPNQASSDIKLPENFVLEALESDTNLFEAPFHYTYLLIVTQKPSFDKIMSKLHRLDNPTAIIQSVNSSTSADS